MKASPILNRKTKPRTASAIATPFLAKKRMRGPATVPPSPSGRAPERAGYPQAGSDSLFVLGLGGEAFRACSLAHEQEADIAEHDHDAEHEERRLPVVFDACGLEPAGGLQRDDAAELEAAPPADDRNGRAGRHRLAFRLAHLLDPERVDGDVLGRGGDRDGEADGDDETQAFGRVQRAPQHEAQQDRRPEGRGSRRAAGRSGRESHGSRTRSMSGAQRKLNA